MGIVSSLPSKLLAIYAAAPHQTHCLRILGHIAKISTSYFGSPEAKATYLT